MDPLDKAKIDGHKWETFFKDLYRGQPHHLKADNLTSPNTLFANNFSTKELAEAIIDLKNKKASGLDNITHQFLKATPDVE